MSSTLDENIQLPADQATGNKNKIRVLALIPPTAVADGDGITTVLQEVISLADDDGNLLISGGMGAKALVVDMGVLENKLDELIEGIAHMLSLLETGLRPRRKLGMMHDWVDRVMARRMTGGS